MGSTVFKKEKDNPETLARGADCAIECINSNVDGHCERIKISDDGQCQYDTGLPGYTPIPDYDFYRGEQ